MADISNNLSVDSGIMTVQANLEDRCVKIQPGVLQPQVGLMHPRTGYQFSGRFRRVESCKLPICGYIKWVQTCKHLSVGIKWVQTPICGYQNHHGSSSFKELSHLEYCKLPNWFHPKPTSTYTVYDRIDAALE